jgi:hypothetical protein
MSIRLKCVLSLWTRAAGRRAAANPLTRDEASADLPVVEGEAAYIPAAVSAGASLPPFLGIELGGNAGRIYQIAEQHGDVSTLAKFGTRPATFPPAPSR